MAEERVQNFENHVNFPTPYVVVATVLLIGVLMEIAGLIMVTTTMGVCLIGTGAAVIGVATIAGLTICRMYATKLQDRIIRTEMRIRLKEVLPADLHAAIPTLTRAQYIALRFASDEELPDLVRKVTTEHITESKPIKQSIKNWQADWFRV
jgi:hypothetical protein